MSGKFFFMCINNYNDKSSLSIPFEVTKQSNAFIIAQALHEQSDKFLYFREALSYISELDNRDELFSMPFGYDGSYRTAYLESCCVCVRPEWNPIYAKDMAFKPVPYIIVNGKPQFNKNYIFDKDSLLEDIISQYLHTCSQKMVKEVGGFDVYYSPGFKRFDFDKAREEIDKQIECDVLELGDQFVVMHNLVANTFEEFVELFPNYKAYATIYEDQLK